ncbi:hypothetical protein CDL15_Pgr028145 [Punica granatum]|uniref:Uncharacterized protein n=1 Tax=Punica granatum TaxID=22663 RepID=A0A218XGU5_PUNGR|nr:hypothetical protein CDL15_Pgr028145 [Punica granatum]
MAGGAEEGRLALGRGFVGMAWLALPPGWLCFVGGPLCPSGGSASDLPEADPAVGSIVCYSCWQLVSSLKRLLAGNALVSPMEFLLARRLLVAGWAVVHLLRTGV